MKLENIIESAVENPHLLDKFEENIEKIRKPNALKDICDFAESFEKVEYKTIEEITKNDYAKIRRQIRKINSKEQIAEIKKKQYTKKLERLEKKLTLKEAKQEIRDNKKQEESKKKEIEKRLTNPKKIVRSMRGIQNSTKSRIKISKVKYK